MKNILAIYDQIFDKIFYSNAFYSQCSIFVFYTYNVYCCVNTCPQYKTDYICHYFLQVQYPINSIFT